MGRTLTRWQNTAGYETYDSPLRAICVAMLSVAIVDYAVLGQQRAQQLRRKGHDWIRRYPRKYGGGYYPRVPKVYQRVRSMVAWIYGWQFGLMVDVLELELEQVQAFFIRLMAGPPVDG
jgi:hypothetical protein